MKKGWERKTLGEVCEVQRGSSPRPIQKYTTTSEDGVNWIKIGDTKNVNKYIFETREKITKEGALKSRYVKEGDFILSNSMSLGKPFIMKTDGYIHDGWFVLRLPDYLDKDYFYYLLTSDEVQNQFTNLSAGAIVKNISGDLVKKTLLPIPPLKEQEEIVSKLDKGFELIDRLKENAEKNLENAKELFQSALREELSPKKGWETKKLKEIGNATTGQTPPTKDKDNFGDFIPFVKPADFLNGKLDYNNDGLSEKGMKYSRISEKGATLMVCIGATIGKTAFTEQNVTSNQQINSIYPNKDFFPKYIYYLLISKDFYNQVLKNASQATLPIINKSKWENLSVSFPSNIKQQEEIVTKLDKIKAMCEELEENYKKSVLLCEELKQGLLREVFED